MWTGTLGICLRRYPSRFLRWRYRFPLYIFTVDFCVDRFAVRNGAVCRRELVPFAKCHLTTCADDDVEVAQCVPLLAANEDRNT